MQRARSLDLFWTQHWVPYTESLGLDPFLSTVADKVPYLRILAHRIRSGAASRSGQPVRSPRVCDEILAVAKGFTDMGQPDLCLTSTGLMDPGSRGCTPPTPMMIRLHIALNPSQSKSSTTPRLSSSPLPRPNLPPPSK